MMNRHHVIMTSTLQPTFRPQIRAQCLVRPIHTPICTRRPALNTHTHTYTLPHASTHVSRTRLELDLLAGIGAAANPRHADQIELLLDANLADDVDLHRAVGRSLWQ